MSSRRDTAFPDLINDRILKAANGQKPDKLPVWIMRQAGRYLPEFQELRKKYNFFEICENVNLVSQATLMPIKRFDLDAAIIFSDILVIPKALGMEVQMKPGVGPVLPKPITPETVNTLNTDGVMARLEYVGKAITQTRFDLEGKAPLFGFTGAPWTLMGYMVEGGGSRTLSQAKKWLYCHHEAANRLLQLLTDVIIDYLVLQVEAGAQMLQIFDSNADLLNKSLYTKYCIPLLKQIKEKVPEKLAATCLKPVPVVLYVKGAHYCIPELAAIGFEVLGLDWTMEPQVVKEQLKDKKITLQGNLDPCALYASKEELGRIVEKMVKEFGHDRYIVNLGHGIYPDMDPEAVRKFVDTVHSIKI